MSIRNLAPASKKTYSDRLKNYMVSRGISDPDQLIVDKSTGQRFSNEEIEDQIIEWINNSDADGVKGTSIQTTIAALKCFYETGNRIRLAWGHIRSRIPLTSAEETRAPTKDEIKLILDHAEPRDKAMAGFLKDNGMRETALAELKVRNVREVKPEELAHHAGCACLDKSAPLQFGGRIVRVYDNDKEDRYFTFIGSETTQWLDQYMGLRLRAGEKMTQDSPLFRTDFNGQKGWSVDNPRHLTGKGIYTIFERLEIKAGVRVKKKKADGSKMNSREGGRVRYEFKAVHGFRSFAITTMTNCKLHPDFRKLILGHENDLQENYYDDTIPESVHAALAEFLVAEKALNIYNISWFEAENARLKAQLSDIDKIKAEMRTEIEAKIEQESKKAQESFIERMQRGHLRDPANMLSVIRRTTC